MGARVINGDHSLVGTKDGIPYAFGLPYAGSSKICFNEEYPMGAVVLLSQASENRVKKIVGADAFKAIYKNIWLNTWSKYDVTAVTALNASIATQIPVFHLECLPNEGAVNILKDAIDKYLI